jgi:hypothetical protein
MAVLVYATQVRGLSLDEVYSAIVRHDRRPLMVTFVEPVASLQGQHPTAKDDEQQQAVTLGLSHQPTYGGKGKEKIEGDTHRTLVRRYLAEKGMEACTEGVCRALAQHGTEGSQWLSTLTTMTPGTRRDLLESVRAQYARESPLRSLGKFASCMTGLPHTPVAVCVQLARRADTTAASVAPAIDGNDSLFNSEVRERKLLLPQTLGHTSGRLDESVEQSHGLESNVGQNRSLDDDSPELSPADAERILAESESDRNVIHDAL